MKCGVDPILDVNPRSLFLFPYEIGYFTICCNICGFSPNLVKEKSIHFGVVPDLDQS